MSIDMTGALRTALGWLHPGLKVKRWLLLLTVGVAALSLGVLLIANLAVFDLIGSLGGPRPAVAVGMVAVVCGLAAVAVSLRQLVRSVAIALHPEADSRLVDLMLSQRRLQVGPRVVAIGGGTGLSTLLRGLKRYTTNITAIATVADDGGSSGRLREDMGVPAPGDIRNCLVALADSEPLMTELFQYRFNGQAAGLGGHSFGNLLIAALTEI
ncbi:MAG: 2-phospho-L-lactate transferase CofD family protein, partial [Armatimonadota bacterium]